MDLGPVDLFNYHNLCNEYIYWPRQKGLIYPVNITDTTSINVTKQKMKQIETSVDPQQQTMP